MTERWYSTDLYPFDLDQCPFGVPWAEPCYQQSPDGPHVRCYRFTAAFVAWTDRMVAAAGDRLSAGIRERHQVIREDAARLFSPDVLRSAAAAAAPLPGRDDLPPEYWTLSTPADRLARRAREIDAGLWGPFARLPTDPNAYARSFVFHVRVKGALKRYRIWTPLDSPSGATEYVDEVPPDPPRVVDYQPVYAPVVPKQGRLGPAARLRDGEWIIRWAPSPGEHVWAVVETPSFLFVARAGVLTVGPRQIEVHVPVGRHPGRYTVPMTHVFPSSVQANRFLKRVN